MQLVRTLRIADHPVSEYEHPNGLRVLHVQKTSAPVVGIFRAVEAGSNDEPGLVGRGVAHFIEHMDFRNDEKRTWGLEKKYGVELNAYTNEYMTGYHEVGHKDHFETMLHDDFERFKSKKVPAAWLKTELQAVLNEEQRGNDGQGVFWRTIPKTVFHAAPSQDDTIGKRFDLIHENSEDMTLFREKRYVTNNTTLVIAGDVGADRVLEAVSTTYGTLERGEDVDHSKPEEKPQQGERFVDLIRPAPCIMLGIAYQGPPSLSHSSAVASVVKEIWDMRADDYVRAGKVHSTGMYYPRMRDAFMIVVHASVPGNNKAKADAATKEFKKALYHLVPKPEEMARAKKNLATAHKASFTSVMSTIQTLGASAGLGDWTDVEAHAKAVQRVTKEDVIHFCAAVFAPPRSSVVRLIPGSMPKAAPVMPRNVQLETATMEDMKQEAPIVAVSNNSHVAVHTPGAQAIHVRVSSAFDYDKQSVADVLTASLGNGCTLNDHTFSRERCEMELANRDTVRSFSSSRGFVHASLRLPTTPAEKLTAASIVLNGEYFQPSLRAKDVDVAKTSIIQELLASRDDPNTVGKHLLMNAMFTTSPYTKDIDQQVRDIQAVTQEDVRTLASQLKTSITAITTSHLTEHDDAFTNFVKHFPAGAQKTRLAWVPGTSDSQEIIQPTPGHASNVLLVGQVTDVRDDRIHALKAATHALGGGMSARLMSVVRGEKGLGTYGIYAYVHEGPDHPAFLLVNGTFSPDAAEEGASTVLGIIREWMEHGITEEELENYKTHMAGPRAMTLDNPSKLVSVHHENALLGKDPQEEWDQIPQRAQDLTLENVNATLTSVFNPNHFKIVKMGSWSHMTADDESDEEN